ncbi:MAG: lysophospholipid acyltransferase family protein [Polyangiaceae bacterium]
MKLPTDLDATDSEASPLPSLGAALERLEPWLTRGFDAARWGNRAARQAVAAATDRVLGQDFEDRLRIVRERVGPAGVDPFGLDPEWARHAVAIMSLLHRLYFRTLVFDIDRVPKGAVLLVANHSGQVPLDGMMLGASMFLDANPPRIARSMVEKWTQSMPFISTVFQRVGQVVGVPENARSLLERGECVVVFPEGVKGISKPYKERYQLKPFGLGFMRLALETKTPIVPVGIVGAEEQYISVANMGRLAKLMGVPSLPLLPQMLVPGGQLPLPVRYRIYFGEPLSFSGDPDDDDEAIELKVTEVQRAVGALLDRGLRERPGLFQ